MTTTTVTDSGYAAESCHDGHQTPGPQHHLAPDEQGDGRVIEEETKFTGESPTMQSSSSPDTSTQPPVPDQRSKNGKLAAAGSPRPTSAASSNAPSGRTNSVDGGNGTGQGGQTAGNKEDPRPNDRKSGSSIISISKKKKPRFNLGRKHKSSRKKREKASAKRERKATKTLAIVLGRSNPKTP